MSLDLTTTYLGIDLRSPLVASAGPLTRSLDSLLLLEAAGAGAVVLPSLFVLVGLSWVYLRFGDVPAIAGLFYGLKPAVTALVLHAAHRIGSRALKNRWMWGIAAAAFVALFALDTPFPAIVMLHGCGGLWGKGGEPTASFAYWAEHFRARGYVALLLDSFGPRGEKEICTQEKRRVSPASSDCQPSIWYW